LTQEQGEIATQEKACAVWRQMQELIGSYDGAKFRRYAQSLSLDVLVSHANQHFLKLAPRYKIRRQPGENLEIEIEDLYQAGARRPMASLSGGETFLASLALALGLADLAGRNARIESLFIDEGFGLLDADTLDVAISALESMRQDNKTVGVISHVPVIKERIAARIAVEKQPGGYSTLTTALGI
jgi:exonuclease SbcC